LPRPRSWQFGAPIKTPGVVMSNSRPSTAEKRKTFRKLHEAGCFVIPNPWSVGSARYLQGLGFKALATTSSGHAHSEGYPDGGQSREQVLAHFAEIAEATDVPLNVDFEDGFADNPDGVAESVIRCIATGVAGLSIEDSPQKRTTPLYDLKTAVARVEAARAAIDRVGGEVVFTARAENFIRGVNDLDDVIRRLKAYAAAGADCLYAPGINKREQIEAVVKAVAPKPVNFLNSGAYGFTVSDLAAMGVRRISVGGSLARVAMNAFIRTATEIAKDGKFDGFAGLITNQELNKFFAEDRKKLSS
jgi:2-methylisocitrate lyase-like PEP mutase family enzyme